MIDVDKTFFIQLVNFIFILVTLNFLLIRPIRAILAKRAEWMAGRVGEIDSFTSSAATKMKDYEAALEKARIEAASVRLALKDEGTSAEKKILEDAGTGVASTLGSARAAIADEAAKALATLKAQVEKFSTEATAKILGKGI